MNIGWKTSIAAVVACAAGVAGGATYAKQARPEYSLVPAGAAKFAPLDPRNPNGVQQAVLSGDPKIGPVAFLAKLPKGAGPVHWHSSDHYAFTIEGNIKHWLPGKEAEAASNLPGTFWFQPGGASGAHADECLSDSCTIFIFMPGRFDVIPVAAPKK